MENLRTNALSFEETQMRKLAYFVGAETTRIELKAQIETMRLCLSKWFEYENERDTQINVDELLSETQQLTS